MGRAIFLMVILWALVARAADAPDIVVADFEGDGYGAWTVEGEAFGKAPAKGTLPNQMDVSGFLGKGLVNSYHMGDDAQGRLASPPFKVERKHINFLIGGGMKPGKACVNLIVGGKVVRTATGPNDRPGGTEKLEWESWDVAEFIGQDATIEVLDRVGGGWGHVNVDHIVQSDRPRSAYRRDAERVVAIDRRYLNLPVKNGAAKRRMNVLVDNQVAREFEIELADERPDWWAFLDVSAWKGKSVTLRVDRLADGSKGLENIEQGDAIKDGEDLYREKLRPQFHFTSRRGWLNDPNGLVYANGEYHLYYQHNPYGTEWGNMHWGHAVSADLVHWTELPIALYPKRFDDWAFSGSAVVDKLNTSGWMDGANELIVAAYTSTGRGECMLYSNDRGRTFTEFDGNPVVKHRGRDPKLFWHGPTKRWVMAVYTEEQGSGKGIAIHTSPDLKAWTKRSYVDGFYECPDLFELPLDGDAAKGKWVLFGADGRYLVGAFDGATFTPETKMLPAHFGQGHYASQTYDNAPGGRRVRVAWAQIKHPGMPFNQMMYFPTELTLRTTEEGPRLFENPVREFETLYAGPGVVLYNVKLAPGGENPLAKANGDLFHVRLTAELRGADELALDIRGLPLTYRAKEEQLTFGGKSAPLRTHNGRVVLEVLVDRTSVEVFANHGRVYMPMPAAFKGEGLSLSAGGGEALVHTVDVRELRSIWKR